MNERGRIGIEELCMVWYGEWTDGSRQAREICTEYSM